MQRGFSPSPTNNLKNRNVVNARVPSGCSCRQRGTSEPRVEITLKDTDGFQGVRMMFRLLSSMIYTSYQIVVCIPGERGN